MIDLARSTLSFFRQGAQPEVMDMKSAVESVRFLLAPLMRTRGVVLETTSSGDVTIQAFPGEVRQVVLNLVRNACEATVEVGGRVQVSLTGELAGVEIMVVDHGAGIDPGLMSSLFQFGASTKGDQGNGMGLWTVKHILEKHGGNINVGSVPGKGARFTLWWPRVYIVSEAVATSFDKRGELLPEKSWLTG